MTKVQILNGLILFIIGIIVGAVPTYFVVNQMAENHIKEALVNIGNLYPQNLSTTIISGSVVRVDESGSFFELKTEPKLNPFDDMWPIRVVYIDENTKYFERKPKETDVFNQEMVEYQRRLAAANVRAEIDLPSPPKTFYLLESEFSDIDQGDYLLVESEADISTVPRFTAVRVEIQQIDTPLDSSSIEQLKP